MLPSLLLALLLAPSPAPLEPPGQAVVVPVAGAEGAPLSLPGPDGAPLPVVRAAPDTEDFTLRVLLGALPRAPSARMHGSMAVTDALTALDEGYAEHFQPWVRERTDNPRLREAALGLASRDYAALWLSNVDRTLRTEGVRRNLFVHAQSLPARALDARPDRHALWQEAGTTPTFLADTLRSGQQMVASEGVVATVLHRLVHAPGLGGRFRAPAFYRPFLAPGEEVPVPERRFTPEENGQLKLLAALHALGGRPLDAERPLLVELVEAWGQLFPEEREEAVSLLVHTTFGATVSAEAGRVFRAQARAGLAGDMGAFVEGLPGARALLAGQVREVLEGRASLGGALGPALWLEARDVRVAEAPWAPARTRALRVERRGPLQRCLQRRPGRVALLTRDGGQCVLALHRVLAREQLGGAQPREVRKDAQAPGSAERACARGPSPGRTAFGEWSRRKARPLLVRPLSCTERTGGALAPGSAGADLRRMRLAILQAPTNLGLRPGGVERAGDALLEAQLAERLQTRVVGRVVPRAAYAPVRDGTTHLLNGPGVAEHMGMVAEAVAQVMDHGEVPLVLGGDDSVLLGAALALRRRGRFGMLFLDAHADFCPPADSPTGEVSDSDLAIVTGHGPPLLSDVEGLAPYLRPADVVQLGRRDRAGALEAESRAFASSGVHAVELEDLRRDGMDTSAARALGVLSRRELAGVWVHLDCDVLDDAVMPAVDYRVPGGLRPAELAEVLRRTREGARLVGMTVSIYNPSLDSDGAAARAVVAALSAGLGPAAVAAGSGTTPLTAPPAL